MRVLLDGGIQIHFATVIGYRFTDDGTERWTQRFNEFKAGNPRAVRAAVSVMRHVLGSMQHPEGPTVVIGVPGSKELQLGADKPVTALARGVADALGATLDLAMIQKDPHDALHGQRTVESRRRVLDSAHYRAQHIRVDVANYVIVDDFVTRGDTMQRIAGAIVALSPGARFRGVAVAQTERLQFWRGRGVELNNSDAEQYELLWQANY